MIPLDSKTHEPVEYRTQDCTVQQVDDVSCYLFFFFNKMHFEQILIFTKSSKLQIACLVQDKLYIQHSKEQNDVLTRQLIICLIYLYRHRSIFNPKDVQLHTLEVIQEHYILLVPSYRFLLNDGIKDRDQRQESDFASIFNQNGESYSYFIL